MGKLYNRRKVKRKKDFRQHVNEFKIQISSPPVSFSRIFTFATVEKKLFRSLTKKRHNDEDRGKRQ